MHSEVIPVRTHAHKHARMHARTNEQMSTMQLQCRGIAMCTGVCEDRMFSYEHRHLHRYVHAHLNGHVHRMNQNTNGSARAYFMIIAILLGPQGKLLPRAQLIVGILVDT